MAIPSRVVFLHSTMEIIPLIDIPILVLPATALAVTGNPGLRFAPVCARKSVKRILRGRGNIALSSGRRSRLPTLVVHGGTHRLPCHSDPNKCLTRLSRTFSGRHQIGRPATTTSCRVGCAFPGTASGPPARPGAAHRARNPRAGNLRGRGAEPGVASRRKSGPLLAASSLRQLLARRRTLAELAAATARHDPQPRAPDNPHPRRTLAAHHVNRHGKRDPFRFGMDEAFLCSADRGRFFVPA